jgi:hypothetical protein
MHKPTLEDQGKKLKNFGLENFKGGLFCKNARQMIETKENLKLEIEEFQRVALLRRFCKNLHRTIEARRNPCLFFANNYIPDSCLRLVDSEAHDLCLSV